MKTASLAFLLLVGLFLSRSLVASGVVEVGPVSAEEILRKAVEARGGRKAALNIHSFQAKGTVCFYTSSGPWYEYAPGITNVWPLEVFAMRPNKFRFVTDLNSTAGASFVFVPPRYYENGFDGHTAWEAPPGNPPQSLEGIFWQERREQAEFFAWCDEHENYRSETNLGETDFEGRRCYELKLVRKSGNEETHYYDATNCLLVGIVRSSVFGPSLERFVLSDYREFGGFQFPTRIRYQAEDERDQAHLSSIEQFDSIEVNGMKNPEFTMPRESARIETPRRPQLREVTDVEIETMLQDWVDTDKLADGIVVGILDEQGRRVISRGQMDGKKVNGDTVFEIASTTKVFTRLLLLDMVQRGEMRLDDPVQEFLPSSVHMPTRNGKEITLVQLATHTSGLPPNPSVNWASAEEIDAFLSGYKLSRDPGTKYKYSNLGAELLGQAIELKAGKPYKDLVIERICRPLGMNHTYVNTPSRNGVYVQPGDSGVYSTGNDLLKFASACLGLTHSTLTPLMQHENATHGGVGGRFYSFLVLDPVRRRAVVTLARTENSSYGFARLVLNHLILNQSPKPLDMANIDYEICERYVGQYLSDNNSIWTVRHEGNRLLMQEPCAMSYEVFPQSETTFLNQMVGRSATFVPETTNQPTQLILRDLETDWNWRGGKISAHAPVRGVAFKLNPNTADDYPGQYQSPDGNVLIIRRQGDQFSVQISWKNSAEPYFDELIPGSETFFFDRTGVIAITFLRDTSGKVSSLICHVDQNHIRCARFAAAPAGVTEADADRFIGVWEARNEQTMLHLTITIAKTNASYLATFDNPGNGLKHIPFRNLIIGSKSSLLLQGLGERMATFGAILNDDATELAGTWREGQVSLPVTFKRTTPQTGKTK
jgi:CubicO group peptidase (beta-lactamase class C family)